MRKWSLHSLFLMTILFFPLFAREELLPSFQFISYQDHAQYPSMSRIKFNKNQKKKKKSPNILFFLVDEQRATITYESDELKEWKRKNLVFQTMLAEQGTVFHNHYTNTNACCPARATLHTGQYPNVHGVTQTDGLAKSAISPDMFWLVPFTVPTMGNYLREAGYQTILKGKWHITDASIRLEDGSYLTTFNVEGQPIPEYYAFYLEKNVLHDFGYDGWIGPEPHGSAPLNSGSAIAPPAIGRDVKYTEQIIDALDHLTQKKKPWFLMASYVNPHDIALYGLFTQLSKAQGWDFPIDPTLPEKLFKDEFQLSLNESLQSKPPAQAEYRDVYPVALQPILDIDRYQRFYYTLQKQVDEQMLQVWNKLTSSSAYKDTIVVFTADHGELLASHGHMFQKWYQAYQEATHIPLIISSPLFKNRHQDVYQLSSHVDILPTLLDFVQADPENLRQQLGKKFSLNLPLSGKSLYPFIKNPNKKVKTTVYFYTEDNPTQGPDQVNAMCQTYSSVDQPAAVEASLTFIDDDLWKITHYYSPTGDCGNVSGIDHELYNVTQDPMELNNLYNNPTYLTIQQQLINLQNRQSSRYRIVLYDKKNQELAEE